jgi:hypothetical protein
MRKFALAAIALLSIGVGSAYVASADAHPIVVNRLGQVIWGPSYTPAPPGTGEPSGH